MTTHLSFIDRFTRTILKHGIWKGSTHKKQWHILLRNVIKQYNNTIHDSTKFKPVDAIKESNAPDVKTYSVLRSRFKRKHKEINVGGFCMVCNKEQK